MLPRSLLQIVPFLLPAALYGAAALGKPAALYKANPGVFTDDNNIYYTYVHVGGEKFKVQLDTGSTDLYLTLGDRHIRYVNTTNLQTTETYGGGNASGTIMFSDLRIGSYVAPSQAFLQVENDTVTPTLDGIMGFAFDLAAIHDTFVDAWGNDSALALGKGPGTNIFAANPSLPNFFDLRLGRADTIAGTQGKGDFYIAEHSPSYAHIANAPKLTRTGSALHWNVVLDGMSVNGKPFAFNKSGVDGVPQGKAVAVLDSGFSIPGLPTPVVDAIYNEVPGAAYVESQGVYLLPCDSNVNLTFTFGGIDIPIHPSDVSFVTTSTVEVNGTVSNITICAGGFTRIDLPFAVAGYDMILGDSFLRNVYASFNYGDRDPASNTPGNPYLQMLPTTDITTAWQEFSASRQAAYAQLNPITPEQFIRDYAPFLPGATNSSDSDASSTASATSGPSATSGSGAASTDGAVSNAVEGALSTDGNDDSDAKTSGSDSKYALAAVGLLAANLFIGLVLLGVTLTMCVRGVKGKSAARYAPVKFKEIADDDAERGHLRYSDQ